MSKSNNRVSRTHQIAATLEDLLRTDPSFELSSIGALARHFGVSFPTMSKVVHLVAEKGLIEVRNGRGIARVKTSGSSGLFASVADTLFDKISAKISDGTYPTGSPLPKRDYFVLNEHVSPVTVARTFARLIEENLAHRRGKSLIAGPSPLSASNVKPRQSRPTIVLLLASEDETSWFIKHTFFSAFINRFFGETDRYGFLVSYALINRTAETFPLNIPAGHDAIRDHVAELGSDYLGTIIKANPEWEPSLGDTIHSLVEFGKPVIFLDPADNGNHLTRRALGLGKAPYYRCHFDERGAIALAAHTLRGLGHRTIGIPTHSSPHYTWAPRRVDLIKEVFAERYPSSSIVTSPMKEAFWEFERDFNPATFLAEFRAKLSRIIPSAGTVQKVPRFGNLLVEKTPSMRALIEDGATALISLSDTFAGEIYLWLRSAEIAIPQGTSLISFDNIVDSHIFPVSTIDFGFSTLGYQAAHLFIDDIRVPADRDGNVPGRCTLVDRGSLGPPNG